jgi:hypothetical protein
VVRRIYIFFFVHAGSWPLAHHNTTSSRKSTRMDGHYNSYRIRETVVGYLWKYRAFRSGGDTSLASPPLLPSHLLSFRFSSLHFLSFPLNSQAFPCLRNIAGRSSSVTRVLSMVSTIQRHLSSIYLYFI